MGTRRENCPEKEGEQSVGVSGETTGPSCCSAGHHTQPRETPFVVIAGLYDSERKAGERGGGGGSGVLTDLE